MSSAPPGSPPAVSRGPARPPPPLGRAVRRRFPWVWLLAIAAIGLGAAWLALHREVRFFRIISGSMEPTLPIGTRLSVEPGLSPQVGEIVAFRAPARALPATPVCAAPDQGSGFPSPCGATTELSSNVTLVKRVVAGPGSTVAIVDGRAVVDGALQRAPSTTACGQSSGCSFPVAIRVPAGTFYVLGDNRGASDDSRFWGPVPAGSILGVAVRCSWLGLGCRPRH
jgi:signal peptidase I